MQGKYYYLVASLPYLKFGDKKFPTRELFLEECRKWLNEAEIRAFSEMNIEDPTPSPGDTDLAGRWKSFDAEIRTILAGIRGGDSRGSLKENIYFSKNNIEGKDPLAAEKAIEKVRWDFTEGEEYKHMFDADWLTLYWIKIQILERLARFEKEKGKNIFETLCGVKNEQKDR